MLEEKTEIPPTQKLSQRFLNNVEAIGEYGYLLWAAFGTMRYALSDRRRLLYQMEHIGVNSAPLVLLIGFFTGAIIAWQAAFQLKDFQMHGMIGGQAARVIAMEVGPVLSSLIIAGRIGASMTAEIGAMKITEQIDALRILSIDPVRYVVMPRLSALLAMTPALTILSTLSGVLGAYIVSNFFLHITYQTFLVSVKTYFTPADLFIGVGKSLIFAILIATIGCYYGLTAGGGSEGVGKATIRSFVAASMGILMVDFFLWVILF